VLEPCDAKVSRTVLRGLGVSNGARPLARKFRAPDVVGRKPVRFLLQESTSFSIATDSKYAPNILTPDATLLWKRGVLF